MRYIDADKLIEFANNTKDKTIDANDIARFPIADVRENVRGKWQPIEVKPYFKKHFDTSVACSVCHRKGNKRWNFCSNCGARMEVES